MYAYLYREKDFSTSMREVFQHDQEKTYYCDVINIPPNM